MAAITTRIQTGSYAGAGTISCSTSSATVTGSGTSFTATAVVGQALFGGPIGAIIGYVAQINSTTSLTLTANALQTLSGSGGYTFGGAQVTVKATPLSSAQIDNNFIYLNDYKAEVSDITYANTEWKGVRRNASGEILVSGITAGAATVNAALSCGSFSSTAAVPVTSGGTGLQSSLGNGYLLIGNSSNTFTAARLTATTNQTTVSNSSGGITIGTVQDIATSSNVQFGSIGVGTASPGTAGEIRATNTITSWYSDERLKTNVELIPNALEKVMSLRGVTFNANQLAESFGYTSKEKQVGVLASDVKAVLPEAVKPAPFDIMRLQEGIEISRSGENYMTVQYEKLVPLLIEAIKQLKTELDELKGVK